MSRVKIKRFRFDEVVEPPDGPVDHDLVLTRGTAEESEVIAYGICRRCHAIHEFNDGAARCEAELASMRFGPTASRGIYYDMAACPACSDNESEWTYEVKIVSE